MVLQVSNPAHPTGVSDPGYSVVAGLCEAGEIPAHPTGVSDPGYSVVAGLCEAGEIPHPTGVS
ncbi:MAG: hypothetical protein ACR2OZ_20720, partial [Verrucomicrobiales bacterium]